MPEVSPLLSPAQRRLVGAALGLAATGAIVALLALGLRAFALLLSTFAGVIWPLATAAILALILRPIVVRLERALGGRRLAAVILLYGVAALVCGGLILAVAPVVVAEVVGFFAYLPTLWTKLLSWAEGHFPDWLRIARHYLENPQIRALADTLTAQLSDVGGALAPSLKGAGSGLLSLFAFVASVAIVPVYLFFFLLAGDADPAPRLERNLTFLPPAVRADVVFLLREFIGIVVAFFRGQLLIGGIVGILLALGFTLSGLRFGLALGLLIGFLNIVPYLGSILGLAVALPLAFLQPEGGIGLAALVVGVFAAVQTIEAWFLTPRIMGSQTGLHPVAVIVAIFFWGQALGGVLGMLLAIPLTAFVVTAWRLARRKYLATGSLPDPV